MNPPLRLLFVCVENANRSQMAEAFARELGGDAVEAWSAGSRPAERVGAGSVAAMAELGLDLSGARPKSLDELPPGPWDAVVTMGCGDACPHLPAHRRDDWALPDPRTLGPDAVRTVRDDIRARVAALLTELGVGPAG